MVGVTVFILSVLALTSVNSQGGDPECLCFEEVEAVRNFRNPVVITHSGDGTDRLFVAEQVGMVWILNRNPDMPGGWERQTPAFMDIEVYFEGRDADEQGFLAMVFHPDFANNGLFYCWYTYRIDETEPSYTRLSEFRIHPDNSSFADPDYERVVMQIEQLFWNHNGGDLKFMPDGTLLISTGDGGTAGDPFDLSQNVSSYLGKVLRIDVNGRDGDLEYTIPPDNPYLGQPGAIPELYAIGLRNPWRMFYDPSEFSGFGERYFIGDVGQDAIEEVNILRSGGENFGWSVYEGRQCYKLDQCQELPVNETVLPIAEYTHASGLGIAIIQGPMYRGCENPDLNGWLMFSDWGSGNVFRLLDQGNATEWTGMRTVPTCSPEICQLPLSSEYPPAFLTWGMDERREVYFGSTEGIVPVDTPVGRVYKVVDPNNRDGPCELGK